MSESEGSRNHEIALYVLVFLLNGCGFLIGEWAFQLFASWSARCAAAFLFGAAMALNRKLFR
jgi:hypothetical protein